MTNKSIMGTMVLLAALVGIIGSSVTTWLFLDSRHDPAGTAVIESLKTQVLIYDLFIMDATSTIANYQRSDSNPGRIMELQETRRLLALEKQQRQNEIATRQGN